MGEGFYAALGADFAFIQQNHIIRRADFIGQMCGPKHGEAGCCEIVDVIGDRFARAGIKADGRLIQQQKRGAMDQCTGDFHTSAMAAIERAKLLVNPIRHAETCERVGDAGIGSGARQAVQRREIAHVGAHRSIKIEGRLLEHHADLRQRLLSCAIDAISADFDDFGRGADEAGQHRNQCRFARTIRAKKRCEPAALNCKRDIAQGLFGAPRVAQIFDL